MTPDTGPGAAGRAARLRDVATAADRALARLPDGARDPALRRPGRRYRIETDEEHVARDLARLVLTVVELLRQLMERQALRRFDAGDLTEDQEEHLGATLLRLDEAMDELCRHHGLDRRDLNLDLGPLGPLLPRD